ncbi:MAG TPA: hypothetical protein VM290_03505 [Gaiellaceae bacterium]|nr:hypothetical protein [Gaiellaceae bacterium]
MQHLWKAGMVAAVAAVAVALAPAALAAGPPPDKGRGPGPEAGWKVTRLDDSGRVLDVRSGTGPAPARDEVGVTSLSGCNSVDVWRNSYTALGTLAYRFHQVKHWCWSFPRITSVSVGTYVSDRTFTYYYRGIVGQHDFFYPLWSGDGGRGGHDSMRQAAFENCVLTYGCIKAEYPLVQIWVNGDGWWFYYTAMH